MCVFLFETGLAQNKAYTEHKNKHKITPSYWGEGTHHNSDLHFNIQGTPTCPLLVCHLCLKNCWLDDPDIMKQSRQMEFLFFYPVADAMMPHVAPQKKLCRLAKYVYSRLHLKFRCRGHWGMSWSMVKSKTT